MPLASPGNTDGVVAFNEYGEKSKRNDMPDMQFTCLTYPVLSHRFLLQNYYRRHDETQLML